MRRTKAASIVLGAVSLVGLAGCANNPPETVTSIDQAEERIDEAERAEAQRYATRELNMAREKLLAAREAQQDGDEERAARLAEHAELDATLAIATADNESVQAAVDELRETLTTLQSELERSQERSIPAPEDETPGRATDFPSDDSSDDVPGDLP